MSAAKMGLPRSVCLPAFSTMTVEMPAGEMDALEPAGNSGSRAHRGQPRPKVGKQMRRIAAAPRGLLAPGWASGHALELKRTAKATASQALDVPKVAASASETKVETRGADAELTTHAHGQSAVCVQTPGMPAVKMSDPVPQPTIHGSFRRLRRRAGSSCGSFDSASGSATIRSHRKSQNKRGEGRRSASDLQLSQLLPYVPKAGELLLFSVMTLLPFIVLGFSLVPLLFAEECESAKCLT
jgi:hypothetical protein